MGDTSMGLVIGGAVLAVALTAAIVHYWLERRRARLLRDFDHRDCWRAAYGKAALHGVRAKRRAG
ncbi:hypothetical protein WK73_00910 [Burkholderia ubonensis]|uniref:hypothetical protein n=1 Tax=Burkholderia ubonensis TaxID=101571 RepID=UPI00075269BA|nr:hypothetical protein [Burkholderia ubonensis]KVU78173.1 hypothetical protein WK73_00910 [Burkholderia ubonensis]